MPASVTSLPLAYYIAGVLHPIPAGFRMDRATSRQLTRRVAGIQARYKSFPVYVPCTHYPRRKLERANRAWDHGEFMAGAGILMWWRTGGSGSFPLASRDAFETAVIGDRDVLNLVRTAKGRYDDPKIILPEDGSAKHVQIHNGGPVTMARLGHAIFVPGP